MKLYDLPPLAWNDTQLIYHALARRNEECLVLTSTKEPYVCIGFAQDMKKELDIDYCKKNNIPFFRRETGGGTVYLDENQLFFQLIIHRDNSLTPSGTEAFFRKFLVPVVSALKNLGIHAKFVPLNDLVVSERKISGNGGGEIGDCKVLIGNILLDFDFKKMASILNVPNENYRKRVYQSMLENLTTVNAELGYIPNSHDMRKTLILEHEKLLGPLTPSELDNDTLLLMRELSAKFSKNEWLFQKVPKHSGRDVKIREGVMIVYRKFSTDKWESEIIFELMEGKIMDLELVSASKPDVDITTLSKTLKGKVFEEKQVLNNINELYES